jgi:hypothetical protein
MTCTNCSSDRGGSGVTGRTLISARDPLTRLRLLLYAGGVLMWTAALVVVGPSLVS